MFTGRCNQKSASGDRLLGARAAEEEDVRRGGNGDGSAAKRWLWRGDPAHESGAGVSPSLNQLSSRSTSVLRVWPAILVGIACRKRPQIDLETFDEPFGGLGPTTTLRLLDNLMGSSH